MKEVGNVKAKKKYEERVPAFYRRPKETDPQYVFFFFNFVKSQDL